MPPRLELTGKRFGWLLVEEEMPSEKNGTYWLCSCGCGKKSIVSGSKLVVGDTTSCGCKRNKKNLNFMRRFKKKGSANVG
jgi:hypothetical protein